MEEPNSLKISELSVEEFLNSFSVLVVLGSLSTSFFFGRFFHATLPLSFYWLLPSTVWLIYTIDHLIDAKKLSPDGGSLRHRIHLKYDKTLRFICFILLLANVLLTLFTLPIELIINGGLLALFVLVYFLVVHKYLKSRAFWGKELAIAIGVSWGMAVLPSLQGDLAMDIGDILLILCFTGLNFSNLLIFSYYDHDEDLQQGFQSFSTHYGKALTHELITKFLIGVFASLCIWSFLIQSENKIPLIMAFMLMLHVMGMIVMMEERFTIKNRYRLWGDIIYLFPGIIWFFLQDKILF